MKWKIISAVLFAFILWSYIIPQIRSIYWLYKESASARVCIYDDPPRMTPAHPALGFDWRDAGIPEYSICNN